MSSANDDTPEQDEAERTSRQTGGDAPAAGSIEEREALAKDEDEQFDADEDEQDH